jgi:hypothetical protein
MLNKTEIKKKKIEKYIFFFLSSDKNEQILSKKNYLTVNLKSDLVL